MMRLVLAAIAVALPQRAKHLLYRWYFKWDVHPTARIGASLLLVDRATISEGVNVSHFNVIKGLEQLTLEQGAALGAFNWISGPSRASGAFPRSPERSPSLHMGPEAAIAMRHVIDCTDKVTFEPLSILGGMRSQILTHAADIHRNELVTEPVVIGEASLVFSGCILLAGCRVPPRSVVAAGAVVDRDLGEELQVYGGVPARALKPLDPGNAYVNREKGLIS